MNVTLKRAQDNFIMALTLWREDRGGTPEGRAAIAYVILNRVARQSWWGKNVLEVCTKKWQFSSLTAPGDPQLVIWPSEADSIWQDCLQAVANALDGTLPNPIGRAVNYYDVSIKAPDWATDDKFIAQIGRLRFYEA